MRVDFLICPEQATLFIMTCATSLHYFVFCVLLTIMQIKIFLLEYENISVFHNSGPFKVGSRLTRIEPGNNPFVIATIISHQH